MIAITSDVLARLKVKYSRYVIKHRGCWGWRGTIRNGYGRMTLSVENVCYAIDAHRVSWLIHRGPIPKGIFVLHECDDRACSKPSCLFLGTQLDNVQDMIAKGRERHPPLLGLANGKAKDAYANVEEARQLHRDGHHQREIANTLHVSQSTIWRWVHGATRKTV